MKTIKPTLYLAGKVSGLEYEECFHKFAFKEKELKGIGYEVINPMRIVPRDTPWVAAMEICLDRLFEEKDTLAGVFFMPCRAESSGAFIEKLFCRYFDISEFGEGNPPPAPPLKLADISARQMEAAGFRTAENFAHDHYRTERYAKGCLEVDLTYEGEELVSCGLTISELESMPVSFAEIKKIAQLIGHWEKD